VWNGPLPRGGLRMKTMIRATTVVLVLVLAFTMAGCAASWSGPQSSGGTVMGSTRLSDADSGKTVELAVGAPLVIDLEENGTTGYAWALDGSVPDVLKAAGDEFQPPADTGVVGAAGRRVFEYKAAVAGEGDLKLVYVRSWEKDVAPAKTFTVHVVVK
jgi:inhibitor of cysteine peptidase